ncbi:hypothetical protein [Thiospirillum jenense]|uniref:Uncharacterized protein n=1 Tax=Thiospirillum jenense TaxID=1653858 RepID=A0A839HCV3_9GAMM|nr:hypothetical protein [Thiospirillum jenense]MBB1126785.1 hypothetical protein [Thiospirillum jenense]
MQLVAQLETLLGGQSTCRQAVYKGRVEFGIAPAARSLRLSLAQLLNNK